MNEVQVIDKPALIGMFAEVLEGRLQALEEEAIAARDGTRVDGDHRPDSRGERAAVTSQGYLALGIGPRQEGVRGALALLPRIGVGPRDTVCPGALVTLARVEGGVSQFLVLPGGQGDELEGVVVLSPEAPLVRALRGLGVGEEAELEVGGKMVLVEVDEID